VSPFFFTSRRRRRRQNKKEGSDYFDRTVAAVTPVLAALMKWPG